MEGYSLALIVFAASVIFLAYVVRGMSGFGAGLVATPLMAFMLPMHVVVPVNGLLVFVLFIFLTIRDRREVIWEELKLLAVPTVIGVVAGLLLFTSLDNRWLLAMLGGFLVAYALYMLVVHFFGLPPLRCSQRWAWPVGFGGSFIDTLFGGGGGTLVVIYMHARGVGKAQFRATVAVLWFIEMIARIAGYSLAGYYTAGTLLLVAMLLPMVWAGTWVGERISNRISQEAFSRIIAVLLLLSGISLLLK
ncbi:MAG: sulfite exporter TauE/SafE family protein [Burkholderiales bacterium]|nr:sulfite exporter TauE/SafE family protein [Burkholderiales bacterium]